MSHSIGSAADALAALIPELAEAMRKSPDKGRLVAEVGRLVRLIQLRAAAVELKSNPAGLVIFGNPREWTTIARSIYAIEYVHKRDGESYRHDFQKPVTMYGLPNGDVLLRLKE